MAKAAASNNHLMQMFNLTLNLEFEQYQLKLIEWLVAYGFILISYESI